MIIDFLGTTQAALAASTATVVLLSLSQNASYRRQLRAHPTRAKRAASLGTIIVLSVVFVCPFSPRVEDSKNLKSQTPDFIQQQQQQ